MTRTTLAITFLALTAAADAQTSDKPFKYNGYGYAFFSTGACAHGYANVGAGGGGEGFLWRGLTLGGEAAYQDFPQDRSNGYGVATMNIGWHFVDRSRPKKLDPYLGFTVLGLGFAPGGIAAAGHLTGGVNYWFKERMGVQFGGVFQVVGEEPIIAVRIGLTFR